MNCVWPASFQLCKCAQQCYKKCYLFLPNHFKNCSTTGWNLDFTLGISNVKTFGCLAVLIIFWPLKHLNRRALDTFLNAYFANTYIRATRRFTVIQDRLQKYPKYKPMCLFSKEVHIRWWVWVWTRFLASVKLQKPEQASVAGASLAPSKIGVTNYKIGTIRPTFCKMQALKPWESN